MRKSIVITVMALLIVSSLAIVQPVVAASPEVTFNADTNLTLTGFTPDMTLVVQNNSRVDSLVVNSTSIEVIVPDGYTFLVNSNDRYEMSLSPSDTHAQFTCGDSYSQYSISGKSGTTFTITPTATVCTTSTGGSSAPLSTTSSGSSTSGTSNSGTDETQNTTETTAKIIVKKTPVTITQEKISTTPGEPATDKSGNVTLEQMTADSEVVVSGNVEQLISAMGVARDESAETNYRETVVEKVIADSNITAEMRDIITNFVTYGTKATKIIGAGERAGIINSFKSALGKLPTTKDDWNDVIKIANGRWPSQQSAEAESRASINFKKIYLRDPDMSNAHDNAAITVMAYGLRPANRNLDSEKAAIKTFKAIYGYNPEKATAWDAVRAIAYSGATR